MRKYTPLMLFLDKCKDTEITLSYEEIEKIIGEKLPKTAYEKSQWWSNNDNTHTQSAAWSDVGYRTRNILLGKSITFYKENK